MKTEELLGLCNELGQYFGRATATATDAEENLAICYEIHNKIGGELRDRMDAARKTPHPMDNKPRRKAHI